MKTEILEVNEHSESELRRAAELLQQGELVAFPTETVYGLGANAYSEEAVAKIFQAKGRPSNNPLIVHISSIEKARSLTTGWNERASRLAEAFWPGPLTMILPKHPAIPDIVTAGGMTVGLRMPQHPVALKLLKISGLPLAAPSANLSNQLSPTQVEHVSRGLAGKIPLILDGGACQKGIESTVVDLSSATWRVLRPGSITNAMIKEVLQEDGQPFQEKNQEQTSHQSTIMISPGQLPQHYAPRTPLFALEEEHAKHLLHELDGSQKVIWLTHQPIESISDLKKGQALSPKIHHLLPADPAAYARRLYALFHELDQKSLDRIYITLPPSDSEWLAIRDRLLRASKKL
ncbi:L-threonylcarbamoyladenylate synthase [Planctomycetales bacterium 10988]|nr:L-threonylcarbamoyladenylate synthase [Planctomycetales bacterium 10988]